MEIQMAVFGGVAALARASDSLLSLRGGKAPTEQRATSFPDCGALSRTFRVAGVALSTVVAIAVSGLAPTPAAAQFVCAGSADGTTALSGAGASVAGSA